MLSLPSRSEASFECPKARARSVRPRASGITHVLDKGLSLGEISGLLEVAGPYIDVVKLGWGTALVVGNLDAKLDLYRSRGIELCCGGSLFEYAVLHHRFEGYVVLPQRSCPRRPVAAALTS
jgi:phosphosulfolactate synthase